MAQYLYNYLPQIAAGTTDTTPVLLAGDSSTNPATLEVLTVDKGGAIAPTAEGSYAVYSQSGAWVRNYGTITGGDVDTTGIKSGVGVYLIGGRLDNHYDGVIRGGAGDGSYAGGVGVALRYSGPNPNGQSNDYSGGDIYGGNGGVGAAGGIGVYVVDGATLNTGGGVIGGGAGGSQGGTGGIAVEVATGGSTRLYGVISGGIGGSAAADGIGGTGGVAIEITSTSAGFAVSQNGNTYGGQGGSGAVGGIGIELQGGAFAQNTPSGMIVGGAGGSGSTDYAGGSGGAGANILAGTLYNYGAVKGGAGGLNTGRGDSGTGGVGAYVANGATLANTSGTFSFAGGGSESVSGSVIGGSGAGDSTGGVGVQLGAGATFHNYSAVNGGDGGAGDGGAGGGGAGGVGVAVGSGTLTNAADGATDQVYFATFTTTTAASITGGNGEIGFAGGKGGAGVSVTTGSVNNAGVITGGSGGGSNVYSRLSGAIEVPPQGGAGGAGLLATGFSTLTNTGTIIGGTGGPGGQPPAGYNPAPPVFPASDAAGVGGIGVNIGTSLANLTNSGTITGGAGGVFNLTGNGTEFTVYGSTGGVGVFLLSGSVINSGAIIGGAGTNTGGAGVYLNGGTVDNTGGSIKGGSVGNSYYGGVGVELGGGTLITSGGISGGTGGHSADSVQFFSTGNLATLEVESGASFGGAVGNFTRLDTIDLSNLSVAQVATYFGGAGASVVPGSYVFAGGRDGETLATATDGRLDLTGDFSGQDFVLTTDASGQGTDINLEPACYCRGTRILTEHGAVAIEELEIGDLVKTLSHGMLPIRWIGRRSYDRGSLKSNPDELPVRIAAGALGENLPWRDLSVSQSHALYLGGMLLPAGGLVNGHSIVRDASVHEVTYFHLEFDVHAVIFAEGAPAESFVDDASREIFENAAEFHGLYPAKKRSPARFCAPRMEEGWELEAVRQRLALWTPGAWTPPHHLKLLAN